MTTDLATTASTVSTAPDLPATPTVSGAGALTALGARSLLDRLAPSTKRSYQHAYRALIEAVTGAPCPTDPEALLTIASTLTDASVSEALNLIATTPRKNRDGTTRTTSGGDPIYVSAAYLTQTVSAVRLFARLAGAADPVGVNCENYLAAHRKRSAPAKQVSALDWATADAVVTVTASDGGDVTRLRDAAVIALASDALLRVSELSALDLADITSDGDGTGTVLITRSKTDQDGTGAALFVRAVTLALIDRYLTAAKIDPASDGALFRRIRRGGHVTTQRLTPRSIRQLITDRAAAAGVSGASGHSLRIGAAQSLVAANASLVEAQQAGRWKSPTMPAHYARHQQAKHGAVSRLRPDTTAEAGAVAS